jgi:very-short-patch-repair endonuclease
MMRHAPTDSETALWQLLKECQRDVSFKRQMPPLGYIGDLLCLGGEARR